MTENITPEKLNEWISVFWSLGSKGLIVFAVVYYRDLITKIVGGLFETIYSHLKQK